MSSLPAYLEHMDRLRAARERELDPCAECDLSEEDRILDAMDLLWVHLTPAEKEELSAHAWRAFPGAKPST
jgi:hypothetical protein